MRLARAAYVRPYDVYFFDVDGTVCLGEQAIPGAPQVLAALRAAGRSVHFITNDASKTREAHVARLTRAGIAARGEEILIPTSILSRTLAERHLGGRVLVLGESAVEEALAAAGLIPVGEPDGVEAVVVSHDRRLDFARLTAAFRAVRHGATLYATNADPRRPTADGGEPGAGAVLAAVERASGVKASLIFGKPGREMQRELLRRIGPRTNGSLVVGDQLETDIRLGSDCGLDTALVLTGVDDDRTAPAGVRPTYVLEDLATLVAPDPAGGRLDAVECRRGS